MQVCVVYYHVVSIVSQETRGESASILIQCPKTTVSRATKSEHDIMGNWEWDYSIAICIQSRYLI